MIENLVVGYVTRLRTRALAFRAATSAATAVEFALLSPIILLTIVFLMSIGYILIMSQALDSATQKAARQIRTGAVQGASSGIALTQTQFRTQTVCSQLPSLFDCNKVIVNVQAVPYGTNHPYEYYAFVNAAQSGLIIPALDNTQTSYCPGQAKSYVYLQILYPVNIFMSFLTSATFATTYKGGQYFLIMATATFLNEPFTATASSC